MRYFFPGLIAGALAALLLFSPTTGIEIHPEWWGTLKNISAIETSPAKQPTAARFFVKVNDQNYFLLKGNGSALISGTVADGLTAFSGNGAFYAKFQKIGTEVDFFNASGDRFWKIESMEYPYLSHGGKLILLMNGDHTGIRMVDYNGNISPARISGRTSTALSFSDSADFGGIGFLDGSYCFVNPKGSVIHRGRAPQGNMVKGIAVSGNGRFAAVHYGSNRKDYLRVIDIESGDNDEVELAHIHPVRTSLHVDGDGYCAIIDGDRIMRVSSSGRVKLRLDIPPKRYGQSSISFRDGIYAVAYTMQTGASRLMLFRDDGTVLLSKVFPSESFLDASLQDDLVFLRGSDNIYCYRLQGR
jgi:hypothetical protein